MDIDTSVFIYELKQSEGSTLAEIFDSIEVSSNIPYVGFGDFHKTYVGIDELELPFTDKVKKDSRDGSEIVIGIVVSEEDEVYDFVYVSISGTTPRVRFAYKSSIMDKLPVIENRLSSVVGGLGNKITMNIKGFLKTQFTKHRFDPYILKDIVMTTRGMYINERKRIDNPVIKIRIGEAEGSLYTNSEGRNLRVRVTAPTQRSVSELTKRLGKVFNLYKDNKKKLFKEYEKNTDGVFKKSTYVSVYKSRSYGKSRSIVTNYKYHSRSCSKNKTPMLMTEEEKKEYGLNRESFGYQQIEYNGRSRSVARYPKESDNWFVCNKDEKKGVGYHVGMRPNPKVNKRKGEADHIICCYNESNQRGDVPNKYYSGSSVFTSKGLATGRRNIRIERSSELGNMIASISESDRPFYRYGFDPDSTTSLFNCVTYAISNVEVKAQEVRDSLVGYAYLCKQHMPDKSLEEIEELLQDSKRSVYQEQILDLLECVYERNIFVFQTFDNEEYEMVPPSYKKMYLSPKLSSRDCVILIENMTSGTPHYEVISRNDGSNRFSYSFDSSSDIAKNLLSMFRQITQWTTTSGDPESPLVDQRVTAIGFDLYGKINQIRFQDDLINKLSSPVPPMNIGSNPRILMTAGSSASQMSRFIRMKKIARCLTEYACWLFANNNDVATLNELAEKYITISNDNNYDLLVNPRFNDSIRTISVKDEDTRNRLLYAIRQRGVDRVKSDYKGRTHLSDYFIGVSDFKKTGGDTIIVQGIDNLNKLLTPKDSDVYIFRDDLSLDVDAPYYVELKLFNNKFPVLYLAQGCRSIYTASGIIHRWKVDGHNPGIYTIDRKTISAGVTVCDYENKDTITRKFDTGGEVNDEGRIYIMQYRDDTGKSVFTVLLPLSRVIRKI